MRSRTFYSLGLAALCLTLPACSDPVPDGPSMPIKKVEISLVLDSTLWRVEQENEKVPVTAATVAPIAKSESDAGPLPALVLCPPARLQFPLGAMAPNSQLLFAAGFDESAYEGEDSGKVRFTLRAGGNLLFEHTAAFGAQVKREERIWKRGSLPLADIQEFTVETELIEGTGAPLASFGIMEVVTVEQRARELASAEAPNVVMIVVDTLRYDRLGCYGNTRGLTPNIDAIAARGVVFETAYAAAPWTWPSTASIFTGLTPAEHGITSYEACYLAEELSTFGEVLQNAGWTTGGFSCNPLICPEKAFAQGFEHFQDYTWSHGNVLMDDALEWLGEMGDWRFLLYAQFVDPHDYRPSKAMSAKFVGKAPAGFTRPGVRQLLANKIYAKPYDKEELAAHSAHLSDLYDASVADVDLEVGRLVADLKARGQYENTLFILTADHGEEFLDHGLLYHGSQLHRELVGVPLIISGPGIPQGQRIEERVENRFIAGTLLRHLKLETPGGLDGVDLLDSKASKAAADEPSFVSTVLGMWPNAAGGHSMGQTVHGVLWKNEFLMWLPEGPNGEDEVRLYDLAQNPQADQDLAAQRPKRCTALKAQITRWLQEGALVRPNVLSGGTSALKALQAIGYMGEEEH